MLACMKTFRGAAVTMIAAALILTACTATPAEPQAEPTAAAPPAAKAPCVDFAVLTGKTADLVLSAFDGNQDASDELADIAAAFDAVALAAEGEVADRISATVTILNEQHPLAMSMQPDAYFESLDAVQNACAAAGVDVDVVKWQ